MYEINRGINLATKSNMQHNRGIDYNCIHTYVQRYNNKLIKVGFLK